MRKLVTAATSPATRISFALSLSNSRFMLCQRPFLAEFCLKRTGANVPMD